MEQRRGKRWATKAQGDGEMRSETKRRGVSVEIGDAETGGEAEGDAEAVPTALGRAWGCKRSVKTPQR